VTGIRKPWTAEEREAVARHLSGGHLPGKQEIERCIEKEPCLQQRTWRNIKDYWRRM